MGLGKYGDDSKLSKKEFQGKLSHNPTSPSERTTSVFELRMPNCPQAMQVVIGRTSPRRHASTISVLQQANSK